MSVSAADRHSARGAVVESYLETAFNYRMTDIQAAVGLVQLSKLDAIVRRRRELAARYHEMLADVVESTGLGLRAVRDPEHGTTNYQSYWVMLPDDLAPMRNDVLARLAERGVSARRGIMAAHLEPAYAGHPHVDLPVTEAFTRNSLILPLYHDLTAAEQDTVVEELKAALRVPLISR
jgi:perosamine synthetase